MPRAKYDFNNPYNLLFNEIGCFKTNYTDFLFDFRYIYRDILNYFGDYLKDYAPTIRKRLDTISNVNVQPMCKNRCYIVTDIDHVVFAAVDQDEAVFDNLVNTYFMLEDLIIGNIPDRVNMSYVTEMYLFKNDKLLKVKYLSTLQLAQFMAAFHKENIVNYQGCREDWYAKPRRYAKSKG
jgi:hypothetical protein